MDRLSLIEQNRDFEAYKEIELVNKPKSLKVGGQIEVELVKSVENFAIILSNSKNNLDAVNISDSKKELNISLVKNLKTGVLNSLSQMITGSNYTSVIIGTESVTYSYGNSRKTDTIHSNEKYKVIIGMPYVPDLYLHGSGTITALNIKQDKLNAVVEGSGDIVLKGNSYESILNVEGSGDIKADGFAVLHLAANVRGSGDISCTAIDTANLSVNGSGDIKMYGDPAKIYKNIYGSGDISIKK